MQIGSQSIRGQGIMKFRNTNNHAWRRREEFDVRYKTATFIVRVDRRKGVVLLSIVNDSLSYRIEYQ